MTLIAESESPAATSLAPVLRQVVQEIDRDMAVFNARSMQDIYINRAVKTPTVIAEIVSTLGVMGLTFAVAGLYGLAAYSVSRRTREIGIRMALGADPLSVTKMVSKQGLVLGLAGVAGPLIGFFTCRAITSGTFFNFGHVSVRPFAAVSLLLILTTLGASYLPARRASRIDPLHTLREE
jgi:ABC-type antimicrobial peptide transport system permease subunit